MTNLKPVDVAIIGGGWTGLLTAKEITAKTSLSVAVFERGGPRKLPDYALTMDELDYNIRLRMMQNTAEETITHRHSLKDSAVPVRQHGSFHPGTGTGGAGEHWGGASFRFLPDVFTLRTHLLQKHGAAKLPEDLSIQDWAVTYDDLEPRYWKAEQMMGISGKAGNLRGQKIDGGNIFEGPRQQEYPTPRLKQSYASSMFEVAVRRLGYHPYPTPAANLSEPYKNPDGIMRGSCQYCGHCQRYGCMVGAKAQPSNVLMPVLARRKNFQFHTGSWVRRIVHKNGRATGIQFTGENGEEFFQPASTVVLASFTLNNSRLLLLSKIGTPYDPNTRKGTLGRNLTHQVGTNTRVFFDKPLNAFMGAGELGSRISDFDGDIGFTGAEGEPLRLGMINLSSNGSPPIGSFGLMPQGASKSNWGLEWKKAALEWLDRSASIGLAGEHLAWRQNYMDLDPAYTDKFGDPLLRFTLNWTDHEYKQREFAEQIQAKIAREIGAKFDEGRRPRDRYNVINYQSTHIQGGAIMGTSPENSVVNRYLQHWDLPNLFVIGASSFPQNAGPNPTLTVLAQTYWATEAMTDRYFKHPEKLI
jgi:gluconate 2-dehydrogenase alpha chain